GVGVPLRLVGDGFDDDGAIEYAWSMAEAPEDARFTLLPPTGPEAELVAETAGPYILRLTVTDVEGETGTCTVEVLVSAPPELECPSEEIVAPTRRAVEISTTFTDARGLGSAQWQVLERPSGSEAEPDPGDALITTLTPDRAGTYLLRLTATNVDGLSDTC